VDTRLVPGLQRDSGRSALAGTRPGQRWGPAARARPRPGLAARSAWQGLVPNRTNPGPLRRVLRLQSSAQGPERHRPATRSTRSPALRPRQRPAATSQLVAGTGLAQGQVRVQQEKGCVRSRQPGYLRPVRRGRSRSAPAGLLQPRRDGSPVELGRERQPAEPLPDWQPGDSSPQQRQGMRGQGDRERLPQAAGPERRETPWGAPLEPAQGLPPAASIRSRGST
jgi:hypothetical protein